MKTTYGKPILLRREDVTRDAGDAGYLVNISGYGRRYFCRRLFEYVTRFRLKPGGKAVVRFSARLDHRSRIVVDRNQDVLLLRRASNDSGVYIIRFSYSSLKSLTGYAPTDYYSERVVFRARRVRRAK